MNMNTRLKDRLMTAGTVLVICSMGVSLPGCAPLGVVRSQSQSQSHSQTQSHIQSQSLCHTDFECEMLLTKAGRRAREREGIYKWKLWTSIGFGVIVTGYLYAQRSSRGADQRDSLDVRTPGVTCAANGCAQ